MEEKLYILRFEGSGSTSVRARTAQDAFAVGRLISNNGCKNVEITTRDNRRFTLDQFHAGLVAAGKANNDR